LNITFGVDYSINISSTNEIIEEGGGGCVHWSPHWWFGCAVGEM